MLSAHTPIANSPHHTHTHTHTQPHPKLQHPERGAKSTSAWLEERSQLMAEFGQPDASGLVLADD